MAASLVSPALLVAVELAVLLVLSVVLGRALPVSPLQAAVSRTSPLVAPIAI
jgi:hypothetical protein